MPGYMLRLFSLCDKRSVVLKDKQKDIQKKYQDAMSKYLLLVVKRFVLIIWNISFLLKDAKLLRMMTAVNSDDGMFNTSLQNYSKAELMAGINTYYVAVTAKSIEEILSERIRRAYNCHAWWAEAAEVP